MQFVQLSSSQEGPFICQYADKYKSIWIVSYLFILPLYTTTIDLKQSNQDVIET